MGVNHPCIASPPTCKAYPIAILLHDHCAIYAFLPTPLLYAVHSIILVMVIACKGHHSLHVEYAERENVYGILFRCSLFCEYVHLEYICIHVIYRVHRVEYVIHILVVSPQEYVKRSTGLTHTHTTAEHTTVL